MFALKMTSKPVPRGSTQQLKITVPPDCGEPGTAGMGVGSSATASAKQPDAIKQATHAIARALFAPVSRMRAMPNSIVTHPRESAQLEGEIEGREGRREESSRDRLRARASGVRRQRQRQQ